MDEIVRVYVDSHQGPSEQRHLSDIEAKYRLRKPEGSSSIVSFLAFKFFLSLRFPSLLVLSNIHRNEHGILVHVSVVT